MSRLGTGLILIWQLVAQEIIRMDKEEARAKRLSQEGMGTAAAERDLAEVSKHLWQTHIRQGVTKWGRWGPVASTQQLELGRPLRSV